MNRPASFPLLQLHASSGRVSRRGFLRAAGFSALGTFWVDWARLAVAATPRGRRKATAVILIFNAGAPSHLDLWDPKPNAPSTIRGSFRPIPTAVPGIQISELLPNLAAHADKYAIVRTVHHRHTQHNAGMYWSIVGRPYRIDSTLINPSRADIPSIGTLVGWLACRGGYSGALPPYVITPAPHCDSTAYITPGQYGACLGARFDPLIVPTQANARQLASSGLAQSTTVTADRLVERHTLAARLGAWPGLETASMRTFDVNEEKAFALVGDARARRAFDLSREPPTVRDRYGLHSWGQSHLLARRLVESGVRFVSVVNGPSIVWDTHKDNFRSLKRRLVPPMERAFAALLDDLAQRGLLDTTLVVWMGDFGRTPLINRDAGRDHWPQCYSMVLAGGGIRGGQVFGESDRTGGHPKSFPVTPADIHATILTALGYDPHGIHYAGPEGRPFPLSDGEPIRQLL
jgi:hypothetical protein